MVMEGQVATDLSIRIVVTFSDAAAAADGKNEFETKSKTEMGKDMFGDDPPTVTVSGNRLTVTGRISAKTLIAKSKKP
jgi:hypothetical protein